ncbi:MAG: hypothetical protein UY36_C0013G0004 [Parcubacteria group bacterium GW2011_GWA1_49_11]|nr:MAG: hypothetical protein UY36_C0013G0004 [Parcubacteria group bacterium GW2011_GWA1_49_11]
MEQPSQTKTISALVVILLILGVGFLLLTKYRVSLNQENLPTSSNVGDEQVTVVVKNTPMVNGITSAPTGFPRDIPLESGNLTESATTQYPRENARQLSLSYLSLKTIAQKYAEYKNYMERTGYQITEGSTSSSLRTIWGAKQNVNLTVVVSGRENRTLVQLSYLLK